MLLKSTYDIIHSNSPSEDLIILNHNQPQDLGILWCFIIW